MGLCVDCFAGKVHNPSTTVTAITLASGDTNTIRNFALTSSAWIYQIIRHGATGGVVRVRSPLLYDNVQGIRATLSEDPAAFLFGPDVQTLVRPQDTLTVELTGGAAEDDTAAIGIYYADLPGANARLVRWADIVGNIETVVSIEVDITNSATTGTWTDTAINATFDNLKANRDHAILGVVTDTIQGGIAIKGPDTSNFRVLAPPHKTSFESAEAFVRLSNAHGVPFIPVFNSANKASTFVSTIDNVASTTPKVSVVCALLKTNLS